MVTSCILSATLLLLAALLLTALLLTALHWRLTILTTHTADSCYVDIDFAFGHNAYVSDDRVIIGMLVVELETLGTHITRYIDNLGTCVTALLASIGTNTNAKRVTLIYLTFTTISMSIFTVIVWLFKGPLVELLTSFFPGTDPMSLQMRTSSFHTLYNVISCAMLLPFVKPLVMFSERMIKDKVTVADTRTLKYVDDRLLTTPPVALMQVKKEANAPVSKVAEIMEIAPKAVTMAMGIAVTALTILDALDVNSAMVMLGIGLACAGIALMSGKK